VATGTGTAGWEAILRGKPTIIFGYPWYRDFPGLFRVSDVESTKEAFKKIIDGFCPNKQEIINYLKSYEEASIPGYLETIKEMKDLKLTRDESINNITQAILSEIRKI
jgi:capsule polysaccharide export protein KpsC/LpsZ